MCQTTEGLELQGGLLVHTLASAAWDLGHDEMAC